MDQKEHRYRVMEWVRIAGQMNDVQRERMSRYLMAEVRGGSCSRCGRWGDCVVGKGDVGECWHPGGTIPVKGERAEG